MMFSGLTGKGDAMFGVEGTMSFLKENSGLRNDELLDKFHLTLQNYQGTASQPDDITYMVIELTGTP